MQERDNDSLVNQLEIFQAMCKRAGIRLTHQRLELFREMAKTRDHPSAEDLYERIRTKMPTISLDTVYRTLATFERHGIIARLQILGERARFDSNPSAHHHLVCVKCKRIGDFDWPGFSNIEVPPETNEWGRVSSKHVELRGLCKKCLEKQRKK